MSPADSRLDDDDFQDLVHIEKRQRLEHCSTKDEFGDESDDLIRAKCNLCNEPWANSGEHQIVSLKCGDIFGKSCIINAIKIAKKLHGPKACASCPECGEPVKKLDLWPYYSKKVVPDDTMQLERFRKQIRTKESLLTEMQQRLSHLLKEQQQLRISLAQLYETAPASEPLVTTVLQPIVPLTPKDEVKIAVRPMYNLIGIKHLAGQGQKVSRVMALNPLNETVVVSMASPQKRHGLCKISLHDLSSMEFTSNHSDQVRDVRCSANGMQLSTGLDRTLQLTSSTSQCVLQTYPLDAPGWSCDFDVSNPNILYCGLATDTSLVFDIRNTRHHLNRLNTSDTGGSPVNCLSSCILDGEPALLCANLKRAYIWRQASQTPTPADCILLGIENEHQPTSVSYDTASDTILVALRRHPTTKFVVGQFMQNQFSSSWSFDHPHYMSSLARTFHFARANDEGKTTVCFGDDSGLIHLRKQSGDKDKVSVHNPPVLDIKHAVIQGSETLLSLTARSLHVHRHSDNFLS